MGAEAHQATWGWEPASFPPARCANPSPRGGSPQAGASLPAEAR